MGRCPSANPKIVGIRVKTWTSGNHTIPVSRERKSVDRYDLGHHQSDAEMRNPGGGVGARIPASNSTTKRRRETADVLRITMRAPGKASAPSSRRVSWRDASSGEGDRAPFY